MSILESVNGTNASNSHNPAPELFSNQGCVPGVGCAGTGLGKGQVGGGPNNRVEIVCMPKSNAKNNSGNKNNNGNAVRKYLGPQSLPLNPGSMSGAKSK